jgi:glycosyltransferase involved in cell wall biosynthesis
MKVVFFTQGRRTPSSRFRAEQLVPGLEGRGIGCTVLPPYPSLQGELDRAWPRGAWRALWKPLGVLSRARQLPRADEHDVVVIQRPLMPYASTVFERRVTRRRPAIFDFDDAIFHHAWGFGGVKVRRIVDLCQHVVVGNQYLADFVARPAKTTIIPTVLDTDRWLPRPPPEGPFTIGWTGLSSNLRELRPLVPVLAEVLRATRGRLLVVVDQAPPAWLRGLPVEYAAWHPSTEVTALDAVDVGIMPLRDTPFNRGKCAFKLLQYMAREIPVVGSPVGANRDIVRHGVDGFLASGGDDWRRALLDLASDPNLRRRFGEAGRARVEAGFSVRAVLPRYVSVFSAVAAGGARC